MIRAFFLILSIANLALPALTPADAQAVPIEIRGAQPAAAAIPRTADGHPDKHIITRPESRVIERFELIGPDELFYRFTVEDTAIYTGPWSAEYVFTRSKERVYEYSCHEHNYSLVNILQAGRVADAKAAKTALPKRR